MQQQYADSNPSLFSNPNPQSYNDESYFAAFDPPAAAGYYQDPYAQNWLLPHVHDASANVNEQLVAAKVNSISQKTAAKTKIPKKQKVPVQSVRCEVCKIDCNSSEVLEVHKQGKNHKKKLGKMEATLAPVPNNPIIGSQQQNVSKQKVWCEVCKIECNCKEMLELHEQGKKHQKNLEKLKATPALPPIVSEPVPNYPSIDTHKQNFPVQLMRCEVCKIECNNKEMLESHNQGKKHKKNLEKLKTTPEAKEMPNDAAIGVQVNLKKRKANAKEVEDLETKKKNVVQSGTAVDAVRTCEICDVVCNSEISFKSHLVGHKHLAMAKKHYAKEQKNLEPEMNKYVEKSEDLEIRMKNAIENGAAVYALKTCEICDVLCTSDVVFESHIAGQKHLAMVKNQLAKKPEDLETKKKNVVESGTDVDAVRMCEICDVVCNSDVVFKYHLAGKKHAAMVKKGKVGRQVDGNANV